MRWDQSPKLGQRLCEAWGLDPKSVRGISIDINPTRTTVLVEFAADGGEDEFARYRLEPADES